MAEERAPRVEIPDSHLSTEMRRALSEVGMVTTVPASAPLFRRVPRQEEVAPPWGAPATGERASGAEAERGGPQAGGAGGGGAPPNAGGGEAAGFSHPGDGVAALAARGKGGGGCGVGCGRCGGCCGGCTGSCVGTGGVAGFTTPA